MSAKLKRKLRQAAGVTTMLVIAAAQATGLTGAAQTIGALVSYRKYQQPVFWDSTTKTAIIHWSRQIGKSYTLAGWAVKRLLDRPGRLVTVLSNSRDNGAEFVVKCHEIVNKLKEAQKIEAYEIDSNQDELDARNDLAEDLKYELMRFEVRITVGGQTGRIKVLAANPRTARGFSGDLILDEFGFHENSAAIWDAAEPIISSNPDYLCRISSTGNGRHNMFYQLIADGLIPYYRVRRSEAWATGELKIYSIITGAEITPDEARGQAADKASYDQNYECAFNDEASVLLTQDMINSAQREGIQIDRQEWSEENLAKLRGLAAFWAGQDVGRKVDLSVITALEKTGSRYRVIAMLEMAGMSGPAQLEQIKRMAELPGFRGLEIDMTGLGTFLVDFAQALPGCGSRIRGVNFSSKEPISDRLRTDGKKGETALVTELMATDMLGIFNDRCIEIPANKELRDDLRKPEKLVSPGGRVSIAAVRDEAGHADRFWSIALAIRATHTAGVWAAEPVARPNPINLTTGTATADYGEESGYAPRRERQSGILMSVKNSNPQRPLDFAPRRFEGHLSPTLASQRLCNALARACNALAAQAAIAFWPSGLTMAANGEIEDDAAANAKLVTASLEEAGETPVLCAANAADGWIKLLPYNTYPHPTVGPQVVSKDTVEQMASNLKGAWSRVKQVLSYFTDVSAALPVYNGHPDDPHFAANGHNDWNTYARVPEVQAREDGMWINVQYNDLGRRLLASGQKLYFSPRWAGRTAANGDYLPRKLLSFGLFPNPNIKEAAAANAQTQTTMNPLLKAILAALGINDEQATTAANAKADAVETSEPLKKLNELVTKAGKVAGLETDLTAANGKVTTLTADLTTAKTGKTEADTKAANAETKLTTVSNAARDGLIAFAVEHGRIAKAGEADWKRQFDADFVAAANALAKVKPNTALPTQSKTRDLSAQRDVAVSNAADKFNEIVARVRKDNPKLTFTEAWKRAKKDKEGAQCLELMNG